jgi:hypothetical protein
VFFALLVAFLLVVVACGSLVASAVSAACSEDVVVTFFGPVTAQEGVGVAGRAARAPRCGRGHHGARCGLLADAPRRRSGVLPRLGWAV